MLLLTALALFSISAAPPGKDDKPRAMTQRDAAPRPDEEESEDEEEGRKVDPSNPIVITARRLDAARTRVDEGLGATVYSLTNEAIENRPGGETGSLADILTRAPGVALTGGRLAVRGSPAMQVRINDVIVPEAIPDPADHLSARLAETTRLITGTLPAQFGFAPAGVIAVTTKSGTYQRGGQIELFAGTDSMVEPAAEWSGSMAGVSAFASGSFERERSGIADSAGRRASDGRRGAEGFAFADRVLGSSDRLSLIAGGSRERHDIGATSLPAGEAASGAGYAVGSFQHSAGALTAQASLFAAFATDEMRLAARTRESRRAFGAQIDAADQVGAAHLLRAGLLVARSATGALGAAGERFTVRRTSASLYAQDEWKIARRLTLNSGLRIEWVRGLGSSAAIEPRESLVWSSGGGLTAHLGYARYAAAPPPAEARTGRLPDERDDYYDAGLQQRKGPLTLGLDAYWRSSRNLVESRDMPGEAGTRAFAFERADLAGAELAATYAKGPATAWASFALSRARGRSILGGEGLFAPESLRAAAESWVRLASDRPVLASAGLTWRLGKLSLSGDVLASSGTVRTAAGGRPNGGRAPASAVVDLAGVYRLRIAGHSTDLRLDLTNVGDAGYYSGDAANLEGGWSRRGRGRALTFGIERGF